MGRSETPAAAWTSTLGGDCTKTLQHLGIHLCLEHKGTSDLVPFKNNESGASTAARQPPQAQVTATGCTAEDPNPVREAYLIEAKHYLQSQRQGFSIILACINEAHPMRGPCA